MTAIGQSNFLQALGWAVLNSLWQMALLWIIYQGITGIIRPLSSSKKSSLATALLLTGFGWFIFTFFSIFFDGSVHGAVVSSGLLDVNSNEELNSWLSTMLPIASLVYLVLLILPVIHFGRNYRYVQLIRQYGLQKISVEWRIFVRKVAAQMGIKTPVQIWVSELVSSPVTIGYLKPVILVPLAAITHLNTQQLEAVLLHELSHIRRFDYLVNLIINFIRSILYFNPFVKAFVRIVEREREKSCDEIVLQFQYDPHGYASALLMLERTSLAVTPLTVPATGKKNELLKRIEIILGVKRGPVVSFNRMAGLLAGLLCIIGLNAILILTKPVHGDKSAPLAGFSSPFYFFTADESQPQAVKEMERKSPPVSNHLVKEDTRIRKNTVHPVNPEPEKITTAPAYNSSYLLVNYMPVTAAIAPELKEYQVEQVKMAINASKKVLEEAQWKVAEKDLADVFTQKEKDHIREQYLKEVDKYDWKKWETKLKSAYNLVDWDRINTQLDNAVTRIKLDSLQKVYSNVAVELNRLQQELTNNNLEAIPDSDVTLKEVEQKALQVQKYLNTLRAVRTKKIIHL